MSIAPWTLDAIAAIWDEHGAKALGFRVFTLGKAGSKPRACKRLTAILLSNQKHLECHRNADLEDLADSFQAQLLVALVHIKQQGIDAVNAKLDTHYNIRMTFWVFVRDLANIKALSNAALGRTPEIEAADHQRRKEKAQAIQAFKHDVDDFIAQVVRLSGDNPGKLTAALAAARHGLLLAEDTLRQLPPP